MTDSHHRAYALMMVNQLVSRDVLAAFVFERDIHIMQLFGRYPPPPHGGWLAEPKEEDYVSPITECVCRSHFRVWHKSDQRWAEVCADRKFNQAYSGTSFLLRHR